jgi:Protein of unknown function (DUF2934)
MGKTSTAKGKSQKKAVKASHAASPAPASEPFEHHVRARAYSIWIEEGRPEGRAHAHWQRAHHELQNEARS